MWKSDVNFTREDAAIVSSSDDTSSEEEDLLVEPLCFPDMEEGVKETLLHMSQQEAMQQQVFMEESEKQWRTKGLAHNIQLGASFLCLATATLYVPRFLYGILARCDGEAFFTLRTVNSAINILILIPSCIRLMLKPTLCSYTVLALITLTDFVLSHIVAFPPSCPEIARSWSCTVNEQQSRACGLMDVTKVQSCMVVILSQIVLQPQYTEALAISVWCCVWLLAIASTTSAAGVQGSVQSEDERRLEFFARLFLFGVVQFIASNKKRAIDKDQRRMVLADYRRKVVSAKMFKILNYMVPTFAVKQMLQKPLEPVFFSSSCASVLFILINDFDRVTHNKSPLEVLQLLNIYFGRFDELCEKYAVTKIESVGEEYVCAVGVVQPDQESEEGVGHTDLLARLVRVASSILSESGSVDLKMGMHTGPVVAGIIGSKLPRYRLFGDTVNTAARMMQKGLPGKLQLGQATHDLLPAWVVSEKRGLVEMKGKGQVMTYLISTGSKGSSPSGNVIQPTSALYVALHEGLDVISARSSALFSDSQQDTEFFDEFMQDLGRDTEEGYCLRALGPGWKSFPEGLEEAFQDWFYSVALLQDLPRRLRLHVLLIVLLTAWEVSYITYTEGGMRSWPKFVTCLSQIQPYLACRLASVATMALEAVAAKGFGAPALWPRVLFWTLHVATVFFITVAYLTLKTYGSSRFGAGGLVQRNMVVMMVMPVYTYFGMVHPLLFRTSLAVNAAYFLYYFALRWTDWVWSPLARYPGSLTIFLASSLMPIVKAYVDEKSLRGSYQANHSIERMRQRIDGILETLMPPMVAESISRNPSSIGVVSHHYFKATIAQSDLAGFTKFASSKEPAEIIVCISELFGTFDRLADMYGVYKVETIGDAYIAGQAEEPLTEKNSPISVLYFSRGMILATSKWSQQRQAMVQCRVGVHTGECIGGLVGRDKQRYHLFGRLMAELEILESTSTPEKVQISSSCRRAVDHQLQEMPTGTAGVSFLARSDPALVTSKGEAHSYEEVGGQTFFVEAAAVRGD
eukprot:TRINITY_DN18144_c0_g1_i1.p1 TRINITY_DN18144_c0_g1~~TRINITY_DN18144_c0_g1_i1.p1  ORF type:complete len:1028 (-),score=136.27 TRINITY_DN18144_c0_g1_i1:196-3279(-)